MIKKTSTKISTLSLGTATLLMASASHAMDFKVDKTDVNLYGYAKLDAIYDFDADLGNTILRNRIRTDNEPGVDGHTTMHAYQSRLGLITSTLVAGHKLKTRIEGDFYGNGGFGDGGGGFRLRHAYGVWNGVLAGQTWSNFGNTISLTPTVDFNGTLAQGGGRQAQLRYTTGDLSVSLEDPREGGKVAAEDTNQYQLPDLTVRYQGSIGPVQLAGAALARYLKYDAEGSSTMNPNLDDDTATGWGVVFEASSKVTNAITIRGSVTHGDGIGGYLYLSPGDVGYVDGSGNLETIKKTGGGVSVTVAAGPGAANIGYGFAIADLDDAYDDGAIAGTADKKYTSTFINYIWSPGKPITYGVEAGYHTTEEQNGDDGDAVRVQAMVKYGF